VHTFRIEINDANCDQVADRDPALELMSHELLKLNEKPKRTQLESVSDVASSAASLLRSAIEELGVSNEWQVLKALLKRQLHPRLARLDRISQEKACLKTHGDQEWSNCAGRRRYTSSQSAK
jgi:hypothetical protein